MAEGITAMWNFIQMLIGLVLVIVIAPMVEVIISIVASMLSSVGAIILLCLIIMEKGELKLKGIDKPRINKIKTLAIWSLIITIVSCFGCAFFALPIFALVFINSQSQKAFYIGELEDAIKKANLSLILLIISNSIIISLGVLNMFVRVISFVLK